jgi:hypothetical protein
MSNFKKLEQLGGALQLLIPGSPVVADVFGFGALQGSSNFNIG